MTSIVAAPSNNRKNISQVYLSNALSSPGYNRGRSALNSVPWNITKKSQSLPRPDVSSQISRPLAVVAPSTVTSFNGDVEKENSRDRKKASEGFIKIEKSSKQTLKSFDSFDKKENSRNNENTEKSQSYKKTFDKAKTRDFITENLKSQGISKTSSKESINSAPKIKGNSNEKTIDSSFKEIQNNIKAKQSPDQKEESKAKTKSRRSPATRTNGFVGPALLPKFKTPDVKTEESALSPRYSIQKAENLKHISSNIIPKPKEFTSIRNKFEKNTDSSNKTYGKSCNSDDDAQRLLLLKKQQSYNAKVQNNKKEANPVLENVKLHNHSRSIVKNFVESHKNKVPASLYKEEITEGKDIIPSNSQLQPSCSSKFFPKSKTIVFRKSKSTLSSLSAEEEKNVSSNSIGTTEQKLSNSKIVQSKPDCWIKQSDRSQSVGKEKQIWARSKESPLHSQIQRAKSFYDELSNQENRKSRSDLFKKAPTDLSKSLNESCLPSNQNKQQEIVKSLTIINKNDQNTSNKFNFSLPENNDPETQMPSTSSSNILATTNSPPRPSLSVTDNEPKLDYVTSNYPNVPLSGPRSFIDSPEDLSSSIQTKSKSNENKIKSSCSSFIPRTVTNITTSVTVCLRNSGDHSEGYIVHDVIVEPDEIYHITNSPGPSSPLPVINNDAGVQETSSDSDSVHCGQRSSVKGVGVMEDGRFVTPHPAKRMAPPPNEKTQSLPGFYVNNRATSPPQTFKEAFTSSYSPFSKRKFHPYKKNNPSEDPVPSKYKTEAPPSKKANETKTKPPAEEKKSKGFLGGLFRRKKKENSSSSSDDETKNMKKLKKKQQSNSSSNLQKENIKSVENSSNALPPDQGYKNVSNYIIETVTGKVLKVSPSNSLGRESGFVQNYGQQQIPILPRTAAIKATLGGYGVSLSHDSLAPSAVSWNSESAYGSINSSMRSSRLERSSSNDTINKKDKREALKARVEKLRKKINDSSSEEEVGSIISSQFGSESSLHRTDSINSKTRSSRTERYIRRKAYELETLKIETEKDRRTREAVQARILEIQKSQKQKHKNQDEIDNSKYQIYNGDAFMSRFKPSSNHKNNFSTFSLTAEPNLPPQNNFTGNYFSPAHRSVSYDCNINQPYSPRVAHRKLQNFNSLGVTPPAPPPRDKIRVMSPLDMHRPISYSFESLNQSVTKSPHNINGLPTPRNNQSKVISPLARMDNGTPQQLPPSSPYRKTFCEDFLPSRPVPPKGYFLNEAANQNNINRANASPHSYSNQNHVLLNNEKNISKGIPVANIPPSPSSDYSSYVSDNSSRFPQIQPFDTDFHKASTSPMLTKTAKYIPSQDRTNSLTDKFNFRKKVEHSAKSETNNESPSTKRKVPEPPKRNSSSLSKATGEIMRKHMELIDTFEKSEPEKQIEMQKKVEEAFLKEKERLQKSKCTNFEEALKELETIYQSLNLNSDDILEGAERIDKGIFIDSPLKRSKTPDVTADDLHLRKLDKNLKKLSNTLENVGSYLLISPVHVPSASNPSELKCSKNKKEPDIILDDVTYRQAQKATSSKIPDPQPPFGIPLGPVTKCSDSDYLHTVPTPEEMISMSREPNIVTDDLAFRNLRRDLKSASNKSLNTTELDEILSEANESPHVNRRMLRSASADRMSSTFPAVPIKKLEFHTPRQIKQQQKAKRHGYWKGSPSWTERANLENDPHQEFSSMKASSQPDIRNAIVNESRSSHGGPCPTVDPFAFLVDQDQIIYLDEENPKKILNTVIDSEEVLKPEIFNDKPYKPIDDLLNNKPKPFYLNNENKETASQVISPVDIAKLDDLISTISTVSCEPSTKLSKKNTNIFNEGLETTKTNIEKAIRGSLLVSPNSEVHR